jgi:hypothetical protein
MLAVRESLGNRTTTARAILGSAVRVNRHKQSTSFLGFVLKHMQELRPSGICHALAHVAAAQPLDVQVFNDDKAILLYQGGGQLVLKVTALVGYSLVQTSYLAAQLSIALAAALVAGTLSLEQGQVLFGLSKPAGILDHLASRQCGKVCQAHIDADSWRVPEGSVYVGQFYLKHDVPVSNLIPLEDGHLDRAVVGNLAVLEEAHQAHILDVQPAVLELDPITIDVADRLETTAPLEARIARLLTALDAAEEGLKGLVQAAECLLEGRVVAPGSIGVAGTELLELVGLVSVADTDAVFLPGVPSLLESSVVQLTVGLQDAAEGLALVTIGVKAESVAQQHLLFLLPPTSPLRFDVASDCLSRYLSGSPNVVGASPEGGLTLLEPRELTAEGAGCIAFEVSHDLVHSQSWRKLAKEMYVVRLYLQGNNLSLQLGNFGAKQLVQASDHRTGQHLVAVLGAPYQVIGDVVDSVAGTPIFHRLILAQMFHSVKLSQRQRQEERHSSPR